MQIYENEASKIKMFNNSQINLYKIDMHGIYKNFEMK